MLRADRFHDLEKLYSSAVPISKDEMRADWRKKANRLRRLNVSTMENEFDVEFGQHLDGGLNEFKPIMCVADDANPHELEPLFHQKN